MIRRSPILFAACVFALLAPSPAASAQLASSQPETQQAAGATDAASTPSREEDSVVVGIQGHYRVGHWTGVRLPQRDTDIDTGSAEIQTQDGEGLNVRYEVPRLADQGGWGYVIPGSEAAPLIVRDQSGVKLSTRFPLSGRPEEGASEIPLGMPWIVAIGDTLGVEKIGANELLDRSAKVAVSIPKSASVLPDNVLGYDGVDLLMINHSGREILRQLRKDQRTALREWIVRGGQVFLTLGAEGRQLLGDAPWLASLLPMEAGEPTIIKLDPSAIETFTLTQKPLRTFSGVKLPRAGKSLIVGRTTLRETVPLAARYVVGMGRITVLSADLEDEPFVQWPERLRLVTTLTAGALDVDEERQASQISRSTSFDDLAGQMRLTLDQFSMKRSFGFSIVSLVLMALIAAIGPLDYLLVNRVFGRPLLGWLTFPLVAFGLSAVLVYQARSGEPVSAVASPSPAGETSNGDAAQSASATSPPYQSRLAQSLRCNEVEFIDVDTVESYGRGFAWRFIYSHDASMLDVDVVPIEQMTDISAKIDSVMTAPYGNPGATFGGIQISGDDARMSTYLVSMTDQDDTMRAAIKRLPMSPRSSKSIATRISFEPTIVDISLQRRSGTELLEGTMVNVLPVDLLDGMLIYQNWVYLLPQRLPAGAVIESVQELRQKNFRWQLSRQIALEKSSTQNEVWDPSRKDATRVAEMLMFHQAVGGRKYTMLKHEPLGHLDMSPILSKDRCVLMGRLEHAMTQVTVRSSDVNASSDSASSDNASSNNASQDQASSDRQTPIVPSGDSLSIIRMVIPVVDQ